MVTTLTKGQQYTDPMGNTGTVGFDSQTGKALADGGTTTIPDTTITADSLAPVAPLVLPETTPETASQEIINSATAGSEIKRIQDQDKAEKTSATTDISKLLSDIGVVEGKESGYATQAGADAAKEQSDRFQSLVDIESKALSNYKEELYRNPNLTQTLVGRLATEQERKSASYISDQLINKSIVDRDYDRAISQAERKVEAELAPLKRELDAKKFIFDANIDGWNASEKSVLDNIIKKEERAYDEQVKTKSNMEALKIELRKNGAPDTLISLATQKGSMDEILTIPGIQKYLQSPLERAQLAKLWSDIDTMKTIASPGLSEKERQALLKDTTAKQASARIGVIKAIEAYKNKVISYKGGEAFDWNRLTSTEKRELQTALNTTVGSAINVAQGQGAMGDQEAQRILGNLDVKRRIRSSVIQASADGAIGAQKSLLDNDLSFIESSYPGATSSYQLFADYEKENLPDDAFFSSLDESTLSPEEYFNSIP